MQDVGIPFWGWKPKIIGKCDHGHDLSWGYTWAHTFSSLSSSWIEIGKLATSSTEAICSTEIPGGERKPRTSFPFGLNRSWGTKEAVGRDAREDLGCTAPRTQSTLFVDLNFHLLHSCKFHRTNYVCSEVSVVPGGVCLLPPVRRLPSVIATLRFAWLLRRTGNNPPHSPSTPPGAPVRITSVNLACLSRCWTYKIVFYGQKKNILRNRVYQLLI